MAALYAQRGWGRYPMAAEILVKGIPEHITEGRKA